jgi:serine phosphatase RsbU (regulator of sigma subunit)
VSGLRLRLEPRDGEPFRQEVRGESVIVGRSSKADLVLADRFLSRQHARLFLKDDAWFLEDLGSRNTTFLNDRPLDAPTPVRPGDVIRLADSRVIVEGPQSAVPSSGDGLVGRADESLPAGTLLRPAMLLPAGTPSGTEDAAALAARLGILNEAHRALAAPVTLEALLEVILDRAFSHLHPDEGTIFLRRPDGSPERAASRPRPGARGEPLFSRRLVHEVIDRGVAALVMETTGDERPPRAERVGTPGTRSLVAAPLLDGETCLGTIALRATRREHPFGEEDLGLLEAFAEAAVLRIRNLALSEETARRRLLDQELDLSHDLQMAMLPRALPEGPGIDMAAVLRPARSAGGDLYDVMMEGDRLWLFVGDVSGQGVGTALFMAVTKTLFRAIAPAAASVFEAMSRMNQELSRDNERAVFATAFVARLDLATGDLAYVNAGHNPTCHLEAGRAAAPLGGPVGPALGAVAGHEYRESAVRLQPGDALVLYTDGVAETRNPSGEEFQAARIEAYLEGSRDAAAAEMARGLVGRVEAFAGHTPPRDDLTVLVLRVLGPGA